VLNIKENIMHRSDGLSYLQESLADLVEHRVSVSSGQDQSKVELRHVKDGANILHCQIWWTAVPSSVAHEFMWDAFDVDCPTMADVNELLEDASHAVALGSVPAKPLGWRHATDLPLFLIHPQRFRALHPIGKAMAQFSQGKTDCAFNMSGIQAAGDAYMTAQNRDHQRSCLRTQVVRGRNRDMMDMLHLGTFYADFCCAGRNIFNFPPEMTNLFRRTDVSDIPLDLIQFPFRSLYLSFGSQDELEVAPGWLADGAYVSMLGDRSAIQFALTCVPKDPDQYARWLEHPEPVYVQSIGKDKMAMGIGEAAELVFADQLAELRKQIEKPDKHGLPDGVKDATALFAAAELGHIEGRYRAWEGMLRLVINALAYLSAYPDDIVKQWPKGTPKNLHLLTEDGSFKQKRNAASKLAELGFSEIHYCGKRIQEQADARSRNPDGDSMKTATWVRGHWKKQPYGPALSLRKLQWRMPILRNADSLPDDVAVGHIYQVT
jgi:hypothetical protein